MNIKNGAKVFIKNKKSGKYLFVLRDNNQTISMPDMYGLLGGKIEEDETPIEALQREIREESNLQIDNIIELGSTVNYIVKNEQGEGVFESKLFVFLAQTTATLDNIKLYEGQKLEYFTIEEALNQNNLAPAIREAIRKFKEDLI